MSYPFQGDNLIAQRRSAASGPTLTYGGQRIVYHTSRTAGRLMLRYVNALTGHP